MTMRGNEGLGALVEEYISLRTEWEGALANAARANPIFDQAHQVAVQLRLTSEGRTALLALATHDVAAVALGAAAESTPFAPREASEALRYLAGNPGRHAFSAEMTLKEFEAGRLGMDW